MELQTIIKRYADAFVHIDASDPGGRINRRTKSDYLPGLKTLDEQATVEAVAAWWSTNHPEDFLEATNGQQLGVAYGSIDSAECDHVITTDDGNEPEWAIEAKRIQLVGDNGKQGDYEVGKILSPYLKDRSLLHDAHRLRGDPPARRLAVIGWAYDYDYETCQEAHRRHPDEADRISEIEKVVKKESGELTVKPLVKFADLILRNRRQVVSALYEECVELWRHPCGGRCRIFGWEVVHPSTDDPRHPW
jgi:hypothetical protein